MSERTVFLSYRLDETGKAFARSIQQALTHHGYDVFLDVDGIDAGRWAEQILTEVPKRAHFLLLLTPGALDRCADEGDWVRREFLLAREKGRNIVPVCEESVNPGAMRAAAPEAVKAVFEYQIPTLRHSSFESDIKALTERYIPPHKAPRDAEKPSPAFEIDISRIVKYAPADLIGREAETTVLDDAWERAVRGEAGRPHVLSFIALGGEGKTSLVAKWAAGLAGRGWPGCEGVYAWSFYSQGTREQSAASSDAFLAEGLTFFGDPEMAKSAQGAFEKGRRLGRLVGERRALLILDGVEPLQYPPGPPMDGKLKDQGLAAILTSLATASQGLCVVTSRYPLPDLRAFAQTTAPMHALDRLSTEAGVALLKSLSVKGTQKEFEALVEDVRGHALTLHLLGAYLRDAHGGDIRRRDLVRLEEADVANERRSHAWHVMDAYVKWLAPTTGWRAWLKRLFNAEEREVQAERRRLLSMLSLVGLFDRPASADCIAALLQAPVIPGLTEPFFTVETRWLGLKKNHRPIAAEQVNLALKRLEDAKLLTVSRDGANRLLALDAHPLVREYFAHRLRDEQPEAWRLAHRRLYEHLRETTSDRKPAPSLEDLQPLYQAVAHGCQAGLQQETCDKIYWARILREEEHYTWNKLGAYGAEIGALACFFEKQWSRASVALKEHDRAWVLNEAACCLRAFGRLAESLESIRAALDAFVKLQRFDQATINASTLSELELTLGDVAEAERVARRSVLYAEQNRNPYWMMGTLASHADALHQAGHRAEALARFRKGAEIPLTNQSGYVRPYPLLDYFACDLYLCISERVAWQRTLRLPVILNSSSFFEACNTASLLASEWLKDELNLLSKGLYYLTLGRALLYESILKVSSLDPCRAPVQHAVNGLRRAGTQHELPRALLTRAWLRCLEDNRTGHDSAQSDLDEAWEIAERGPMRLFMADIHLHRARLFGGQADYPWTSPAADIKAARKLIEQCGYGRRKEELEDAERAIGGGGA